jgi:hypothetical protein
LSPVIQTRQIVAAAAALGRLVLLGQSLIGGVLYSARRFG